MVGKSSIGIDGELATARGGKICLESLGVEVWAIKQRQQACLAKAKQDPMGMVDVREDCCL
eukprot:3594469-Karenia_brevis.AAC.1